MIGAIKRSLPWWAKIGAKLVLSRVPAAYAAWQRLGLFRHGHMDAAQYALDVVSSHVQRAGLMGRLRGKSVLELGPGDSVATALIAKAHGARADLVDTGAYARSDLTIYANLAAALREGGLAMPLIEDVSSLDQLLGVCDASYLTEGLQSLRTIEDASVDLVFSQAVLEHVRKHEFLEMQQEVARVLKPGGVCSHRIDLRDHLGGALNNLRLSESVWESPFFADAGFYTNRIGFKRMTEMFGEAGFIVEVTEVRRWPKLPIERRELAEPFRAIPDAELNVSGFDVLLRKPERQGGGETAGRLALGSAELVEPCSDERADDL